MIYNAARLNHLFSYLDEAIPSSFVDYIYALFTSGDDIDISEIEGILSFYKSNIKPLTQLRVYHKSSMKAMIQSIYNILETKGLDYGYKGDEETFFLVEYPQGLNDFLIYGTSSYREEPTFELFTAFLLMVDAFIRGEKFDKDAFNSAMEAFDFGAEFPELDDLTETEIINDKMNGIYESITKSVEIPEYLEEDYIFVEDTFYNKESVEKAISAFSATAQSLERQDLEGSLEGLSLDERAIHFVKLLKSKRKKDAKLP